VWNDRLTKAKASLSELLAFAFRKFGIPFRKEVHRLCHPGDLIFLVRSDYATLANRAEQLIASPIVRRFRLLQLCPIHTTFPRQPTPPFLRSGECKRKQRSDRPGSGAKNRRVFHGFHSQKYNRLSTS
jgi:hypothetical protein